MVMKIITSGSGSWTVPSGVKTVKVTMIGAGGGGGGSAKGSDQCYEGGGGGGGACTQFTMEVSSGSSYSYTIGTGGNGGKGKTTAVQGGGIVGEAGGDGGATTFGSYYVNGGKPGTGGLVYGSTKNNGKGGAGGSGGSSPSTIFSGGAGGAGGKDGSGYGHGGSVLNAGGGGGGIGDSTIYNYATNAGYSPHTDSSANASAQEGGKPGYYGTGGGGDSGFDSGNYGVGGKGGDGLIILVYSLAVDTVSFTIKSTNGIANDPRNNGSESTYLTVTVPIGATYSVIKEQDDSYNGKTGEVEIRYDAEVIYSIPVSSNKGYGNPVWTSKSGTISSSTTVSVTYSKVTYSGTVHLGTKYAKFRIIYPSSYAGEYTSDKVIEYQYQDRVDVDWTGGTTIETVSPYVQRVYTHQDTRSEEVEYVSLPSQTGGDGKTMDAQNSNIFPDPRSSPKPDSYTEYYRVRINFDANGGTLAAGTSGFISEWSTSQDIYADLPPHPTRTNYAFKGWSINNSNPDPKDDPDVYPSESGHYFHFGDVILYAIWGVAITVYFDPYNDSNSDTVYSIKTDPVTDRLISTPPTPTPLDLDWAFSGWKCTQVSYFNTPRSSSEVAAYSFRGVGTELWFFGTYTQRKYYPVVFVDNLDSPASIAKCMKNEKPVLNWSDTIKTDNGENFNPSTKSWQPYQSSQIFEIGYSGQVKLNKIINVFYRSGAPIYSDDNIHMAISCGEYGIIDLGDIQDISDSYSAMLTTIPIAPFGYSGTFCMDRGVQRSLSVGIVRVSPASPDDSSTDSKRWSNSKWISMLRAMTDRWQMMTDGVRLFMYVPKEKAHNVVALDSKYSLDTDGSINGGMTSVNAYISQLPLSYSSDSVHKISLSMTFRVGTIYPKPPVIEMTAVTLKVGSKTKVIQYPSNSYSALPRCPAELLDESSQIFIAWRIDTSTTLVYPGDPFIVGSNAMTLTAYYIDYNAGDCDVYTTEGSTTYTVTVGSGKTHVTICAIGGGGAGARGTSIKSIKQSQSGVTVYPLTAGGAGGGSGYLHARRISVAEGDKLYIKLGRGGQSYSASGERTVVSFDDANGKVIVSAKEGAGGTSSTVGGTGGAGYKSGGAGGYPYVSKKSDYPNDVKYINSIDGSGAPGTFGLGGANDQNWAGGISYFWGGGGGGAAPPRVGKVEGMGGSGVKLKDSSRKMDGTFGGGGGGASAVAGSFGKGGDGYVCLIWE